MSLGETVILTPIPNGWQRGSSASGVLQVTVAVSLQANPPSPAKLGACVPLFRNWCDAANWSGQGQMRFNLALSQRPGAAATELPAQRVGDPPDTRLWSALFPPDMPLEAFPTPKPLPEKVRTFSSTPIIDFTRDTYSHPDLIGAQPASQPDPAWIMHPARFLPLVVPHLTETGRTNLHAAAPHTETLFVSPPPRGATSPSPTAPPNPLPGPAARPADGQTPGPLPWHIETQRAIEFIRRPKPLKPGPTWTPFDFHDLLTALGHYPDLLRRLGLVFDLEVKLPDGTPKQASQVVLNVFPPAAVQDPPRFVSPITLCSMTDTQFTPTPRSKAFAPGCRELALGDAGQFRGDGSTPLFGISEVDALGAATKFDALGHKVAATYNRTDFSPPKLGLPPLRSGGISVFRNDPAEHVASVQRQIVTAQRLHEQLVRPDPGAAANQSPAGDVAGADHPLYAEDLTRGYLLDVFDARTNEWRSVCRRAGSLSIASAPGLTLPLPGDDEGCVGESLAHVPGDDTQAYMEDAVVRWSGWSLVVPMPIGNADETQPVMDPGDPVASGLSPHLSVPPGTLPRLRFGRPYRFRIRTMDIAGNKLPPPAPNEQVTPAAASPPVIYGRLEPVPPPVLALKTLPGAGESTSTAVVRSNGVDVGAPKPAERHMLPPQAAIFLLERHGIFDDPGNPNFTDPKKTYERLTRPGQSLWSDIAALASAKKADIHRAQVHEKDPVKVPYLPDVMAQKVAIRVVKGVEWFDKAEAQFQAFGSGPGFWPDNVQSVTLRVIPTAAGDKAQLRTSEADGVPAVEVYLPPAAQVSLRLTSAPNEALLPHMKVFQWLRDRLAGPDQRQRLAQLTDSLVSGSAPVLTPWETVTALHAVSRPLKRPEPHLTVSRSPTSPTTIDVGGTVAVDFPSTDHVTFYAEWLDFVDAGDDTPDPAFVSMRAVLGTLKVPPKMAVHPVDHVPIQEPPVSFRHHMHDAASRVVTLSAVATPRFRSSFALADTRHPFTGFVFSHSHGDGQLSARMPLGRGEAQKDAQRIERAWIDHIRATGDKNWVLDQAISAGDQPPHVRPVPITPPPDVAGEPVSHVEISAPVIEFVPSCAPPAAPRIDRVVPAFSWERSEGAQGGARTLVAGRLGNRIRVWLKRPWHGSGYPEELAVVLPEQDSDDIPPEVGRLVTRWGHDPASGSPLGSHRSLAFPLAHATPQPSYPVPNFAERARDGGRPPPASGSRVRLAPHAVAFDPETKRYYCDIAVTGLEQVYMPFVQLAVAAFQRAAHPGHELSRIVLADVIQLLPDRIVTTKIAPDRAVVVNVQGTAPRVPWSRNTHGAVEGAVPNVTRGVATNVVVQTEARPAGSKDEFAWQAAAKPVAMSFEDAPGKPTVATSPELWGCKLIKPPPSAGAASVGLDLGRALAQLPHEWRLAIREYEWSAEGAASPPGNATATRLVFAEHVLLPEWA